MDSGGAFCDFSRRPGIRAAIARWLVGVARQTSPPGQSEFANCVIETRPGDPTLFRHDGTEMIVTLRGYVIMPSEAYRGSLGREYSRGLDDARDEDGSGTAESRGACECGHGLVSHPHRQLCRKEDCNCGEYRAACAPPTAREGT
jgi:hypothetical protein